MTELTQRKCNSLLNKKAKGVLEPLTLALLRYFVNRCYFNVPTKEMEVSITGTVTVQDTKKKHKEYRDYEVSLQTISDYIGVYPKTAQHHIDIAVELKLLTVNRPEGGRVSYSLHLDPMMKWKDAKVVRIEQRRKNAANRKAQQRARQKSYQERKAAKAAALLDKFQSENAWEIEVELMGC